MGNPRTVCLHQFRQRIEEAPLVDGRHAHALCALVEACDVVCGPEQGHTTIGLAEGLHTLEDGLPIMQGHRSRTQRHVAIGLDDTSRPLTV